MTDPQSHQDTTAPSPAAEAVAHPVGESEFAGLCAVVTGGASGIGRATATELMRRGARVATLDLSDDGPQGALAIACDLTSDADVPAAVSRVAQELGGIDIVVNNAGMGAQGNAGANDLDEWRRVLDVNVLAMVRVIQAALPHLRASSHAAIVNTASVAGVTGIPQRVLYSATKGAVTAMTLAMAADWAREGIRVCCVHPGTANTPWVGRLLDSAEDPAAERAALEARQPHGRLVEPEEVADAICYLASPRSASSTGIELAVDGGMSSLRTRTPS